MVTRDALVHACAELMVNSVTKDIEDRHVKSSEVGRIHRVCAEQLSEEEMADWLTTAEGDDDVFENHPLTRRVRAQVESMLAAVEQKE